MEKRSKHEVSRAVVFYKLVTGVVEVVLGAGLLVFGKNIGRIYSHYRVRELLEDPHDVLINFVSKFIATFVAHQRVYIMYLMFSLFLLGLVKIIASIGLLRNKEWGLDLMIVLFLVLLPFDIATLFYQPSFLKLIYFLINLLITFYLLEFRPHYYIKRLKRYFNKPI